MKKIITLSLGLSVGFLSIANAQEVNTEQTSVNDITTQNISIKDQATNVFKKIVEQNSQQIAEDYKENIESKELKEEKKTENRTKKESVEELTQPVKTTDLKYKKVEKKKVKEDLTAKEITKIEKKEISKKQVSEVKCDPPKEVKEVKKQPIKSTKKKIYIKPKVKKLEQNQTTPLTPLEQSKLEQYKLEQSKIDTKAVVIEKSVLTDYGSFHIPSNANIKESDFYKFAKPISYDDLDISSKLINDKLSLSLIDKRTNASLDEHYFNENYKKVEVLVLNSDLSKLEEHVINYTTDSNIEIPNINTENSCKIVLGKYQLKTEDSHSGFSYFFKNGEEINELPKDCLVKDIDKRDTVFLAEDMTVINIGFNQKALSEEKLSMTINFSNEGRDFFPNKVFMYAVKTDFSEFHALEPNKQNSKRTLFGVNVTQSIPSGSYYILVGFENHNKTHLIKTLVNIN